MLKKKNGHFIFIVMFILQALGKADGAKNTAKKVSDDVTKALETVTNISTLLGMYLRCFLLSLTSIFIP